MIVTWCNVCEPISRATLNPSQFRHGRIVNGLPSNAQGKLDRALINRLFADLDNHKVPRWLGKQRPDAVSCLLTLADWSH